MNNLPSQIYFDNAATTPLREEVIDAMMQVLKENYGNPSSTHSIGRTAKTILETSRKSIAKLLGAQASEIIFTSSATEASNWILKSARTDLEVKRIITSPIEHHATLYTVQKLALEYNITIDYVKVLPTGALDLENLETLLADNSEKTLVSLMHINNETGEILDISRVSKLCLQYKALFQCDAVQAVGKYNFDLSTLPIDFLVASAHKFHGPKGIGFAFIRKNTAIRPLFYGGEQERGLRAGTEALHQIVGATKALELAHDNLEKDKEYLLELRNYFAEKLKTILPESLILGKNTHYSILNVLLPFDSSKTAMFLFGLDMKRIAVSRGSACQSGSVKPSHVLAGFLSHEQQLQPNIRISFSIYNTKKEIDYFCEVLKEV